MYGCWYYESRYVAAGCYCSIPEVERQLLTEYGPSIPTNGSPYARDVDAWILNVWMLQQPLEEWLLELDARTN